MEKLLYSKKSFPVELPATQISVVVETNRVDLGDLEEAAALTKPACLLNVTVDNGYQINHGRVFGSQDGMETALMPHGPNTLPVVREKEKESRG